MKLTFQKDGLLMALQSVQGVTGTSSLPILSNVMIRTVDGGIECVATDLEISISMSIPGDIIEPGAITIKSKRITDIVKELPNNESIQFKTTEKDRVIIECGSGKYDLVGMSADEFPEMQVLEGESLTMSGQNLCDLIFKTEFAAATEEVRYFLNGVFFKLTPEFTDVVATDGKRLALAKCDPMVSDEESGIIIPLKTVREVSKIYSESVEVRILVVGNKILFSDGIATLVSRLIEGDYPNYMNIIPESTPGKAIVNRVALLSAIRRVSLLSNPHNFAVALHIGHESPSEGVMVYSKAPELGEAREVVSIESASQSEVIGFDARL